MSTWRTRVALGAVLAVAAGLAALIGTDALHRGLLRNPSDAELAAHFRAHRAEYEARLRDQPAGAETLVYWPWSAWYPRVRLGDVKGVAFASRTPPNLVDDLDDLPPAAPRRGVVLRWHRPLEDGWYLYRALGDRSGR